MRRTVIAIVILLQAACAMEPYEEGDLGSETQELCLSCGANGLNKRWAWYWDGTLGPNGLKPYGLWNGDHTVNPICGTAQSGGVCTASANWKNWLTDNAAGDATHTKAGNFEYIVKAAGCQGQSVKANGVTYWGQFCLAPEALTARWGDKQKQIISAAMMLLLNLNDGVPICLATEDRNDCCANGYCVEETIAFGNIFQGAEVTAVAGGKNDGIYVAPTQNQRLCGVNAATACDVALQTWNSADQHCSFNGSAPSTRTPAICDGWTYPVAAHLLSVSYLQIDPSRPRIEQRLYY